MGLVVLHLRPLKGKVINYILLSICASLLLGTILLSVMVMLNRHYKKNSSYPPNALSPSINADDEELITDAELDEESNQDNGDHEQ